MFDVFYSNPFTAIAAGFYSLYQRTNNAFSPVDPYYAAAPASEQPQFGSATPWEDVVASGIFSDYQAGSSEVIPPSYDLPPLPNTPPSPIVPAPPTGGGSSGGEPQLPPATTLPYGLGGSSSLGGLLPSSQQTPEQRRALYRMLPKGKKGDAGARALEKAMGLAPKKRKVTYNTVASKLARKLTGDVLKKIELPAILRSVTGGAGVLLPRVLGPLGMGITGMSIGGMVRDSGLFGTKKPATVRASRKVPGVLKPITVDAKRIVGGTPAMDKALEEYGRGIYTAMPKQVPTFTPIAGQPKEGLLKRLINRNPKTMKNVQVLGAVLDAVKKQRRGATAAAAALLPQLPTSPAASIAPSLSYGQLPWAPTRISSSSSSCSCGPKKKRGPARKCLERGTVVFKTGRYKGKAAGTKCIRYAT
jgi:hypothetical protein